MAKFVLTTWAACLARQKPVSTRAKPACMKITSTAPMTTHSMLSLPAEGGHRIDVGLRRGEAEQETVHELPPHDSWSPGRSGASVRTYESCVSS